MRSMADRQPFLQRVRRALGRAEPLSQAPIPPAIDESVARLVQSDIGLRELFARRAAENAMVVTRVCVEDLAGELIGVLRQAECRRVCLSAGPSLPRWNLFESLSREGFDVHTWEQITLDEAYELDCGVTDVFCAVAETGSLVIRPDAGHGRAISLVPPLHVAIVEPSAVVGDLLDLFEKLWREACGQNVLIITGPSKTADIEMNLVTGVHGPGAVRVFLLE